MDRKAAVVLMFALAACGGGGGGAAGVSVPPANPAPSSAPSAGSSPGPTTAPSSAPTVAPAGSTMIPDTTGRVGLFQEFDKSMTPAQIQSEAPRYDAVWGASQPQFWESAHPGIVLSRYFIPQEDRSRALRPRFELVANQSPRLDSVRLPLRWNADARLRFLARRRQAGRSAGFSQPGRDRLSSAAAQRCKRYRERR